MLACLEPVRIMGWPNAGADLRDFADRAGSLFGSSSAAAASSSVRIARGPDQQIGAIAVGASWIVRAKHDQIVLLAARYGLPTMFPYGFDVRGTGELFSYGPDILDAYRQRGVYTGRILKGEKPGDLPVLLPTKFEFVINLRTASRHTKRRTLAAVAAANGAVIADAFTAFYAAASSSPTAGGKPCLAGLLNVNPSDQSSCDEHPAQSGHILIADIVEATYRAARPRD
jgi:hypothetical protein